MRTSRGIRARAVVHIGSQLSTVLNIPCRGLSCWPTVVSMDTSSIGIHGSFSRSDAIALFGDYRVRREQESGRWVSPWAGVLVEAARAGDPLALASAAVRLGHPDALVAGPTAAYLHGCRWVAPTPVHLIVPYEHVLRSRPGLVVHNGPLPTADREIRHGLPVLCLERTLTDILCARTRSSDALAVLDEALAMVDPGLREKYRARIGERLAARRDPRGTRRAAQVLELATGLAASPAESWLLWRIVDSGFPVPEVNWSVTGLNGREVYRLDLAWPGLRIVLEYDGYLAHVGRAAEDEARAEDLRKRGWIIIRVTVDDLRDPTRFEAELVDAFQQRGVDMSRRCTGKLQGRRHREPGMRRRRRAS